MDNLSTNSAAPLDPALGPPLESAHQSPEPPLPPPTGSLPQESPDHSDRWRIIVEQPEFYDEKDFLHPSYNLTSEKLKNRKEDDVVIFDYSLSGADGGPPVGGGGSSSAGSDEDDGRFFQVSKDRLMEPEQFSQILNPTKEPGLTQSQARLRIM